MAEAIDDVRKLGDDRRIERRVEAFRSQEDIDHRLHLARELLEHEVLVLHLGCELRSLEQALAVPHARRHLPGRDERRIAAGENRGLDLGDLPVVLGVEDVVDGGETDILVAAPIARHEVTAEQLVIVGSCRLHVSRRRYICVSVSHETRGWRSVVRDIVQEGMAGSDGERRVHRVGKIADQHRARAGDELRHSGRGIGDEIAVSVSEQERDVVNVLIVELNTEQFLACAFTWAQVGMPPLSALLSSRPVATGRPFASSTYSRKNT